MARSTPTTRAATPVLCFLAALIEGYDLQSAGLAAPQLAKVYALSPSLLGLVFSASTLGLLAGAMLGGRLSDLVGRKGVLIGSLMAFGGFSIATAFASDVTWLLAMRLCTGVGLGGAFPVIIALVAAAGDPHSQARRVTTTIAGMPLGGALAGVLVGLVPTLDWTAIFHIGGVAPIILALAVARFMREPAPAVMLETSPSGPSRPSPIAAVLFGGGRASATAALWIASFGTLLVLYLLLNWLPTLMIARGVARSEALLAAAAFSAAGGAGTLLLGGLLDLVRRRLLLTVVYGGLAAGLAVLAFDMASPMVAASLAGFFVVGAQFLLYGLSAEPYPADMKGTGAGASVAAGRMGALAGPLIAGQLLSAGGATSQVLALLLPITAAAFLAALPLGRRVRKPADVLGR